MLHKYILKSALFLFISTYPILALDLTQKYPSYMYVFNEFNIDKTYIKDSDFELFVLRNEKNLKNFYKRSLLRGKEILPTMKKILLGEGVSDLFIYLSMIESGFSTTAVSSKKAVGLWQFMPATAKHYNLAVNDIYDERFDASSSTAAAMRYLNKLHREFGKWYLAVMAYNCGEGCIEKAIKKAGTDELTILIDDRLKYVPKETRDYIKKILLIAMIGEHKILDVTEGETYGLTKVDVSSGVDLKKLATLLNMKYNTLLGINKHLKKKRISTHGSKIQIWIPLEKVFAFYLKYEIKNEHKREEKDLVSHFVSLGESIQSIAKKYDTSEEEIIETNYLEDDYLTVGQLLIIPVSKKVFQKVEKGISK